MWKATVLLLAIPLTLGACGGSSHPKATPTRTVTAIPAAPSPSPVAALDNYAKIACQNIDKARTLYARGGLENDTDAINSYDTAIVAAGKSSVEGFPAQIASNGSDNDAVVRDPQKFQRALDGWRSFCESKGWVGI